MSKNKPSTEPEIRQPISPDVELAALEAQPLPAVAGADLKPKDPDDRTLFDALGPVPLDSEGRSLRAPGPPNMVRPDLVGTSAPDYQTVEHGPDHREECLAVLRRALSVCAMLNADNTDPGIVGEIRRVLGPDINAPSPRRAGQLDVDAPPRVLPTEGLTEAQRRA